MHDDDFKIDFSGVVDIRNMPEIVVGDRVFVWKKEVDHVTREAMIEYANGNIVLEPFSRLSISRNTLETKRGEFK